MILNALYNYYLSHLDELPSPGKELKEIGFVIVLSKDGDFMYFEDRRSDDKKNATPFLVRKSVGRTAAPRPNFLYDNASYVLGYSDKGNAMKCYKTFKEYIDKTAAKAPDNRDLQRLKIFYEQDVDQKLAKMKADPLWPEIIKNLNKKFSFFTFRFKGEDDVVAEKPELIELDISESQDAKDTQKANSRKKCMISGKEDEIVEITTATMIPGSQAVAKLVAFQVNSGYDSYGKKKGGNAPIGKTVEFGYTTALNKMLGKDSRNRFFLGDRTFVFWSSNRNEACSELEKALNNLVANDENDPEQIKKVLMTIYTGKTPTSSDDRFFILGLSPNSARIAVNYWAEIPLKEFAGNLLKHFEDFQIADVRKEKKPYTGLRSILAAVTLGGKASDATPNLPEAIVKSIFQNLPYPEPLFSAAIRRIRAEQTVGITRAAIIKGYLNRLRNNNYKIKTMLETTSSHPGYVCGRLFAVLEKIQSDANNTSTIRERYFNSASTNPVTVFPTLVNLSVHHLAKLEMKDQIFYLKLIQEIINLLTSDGFPIQLQNVEQGHFIIGYFHQRCALYTSRKTTTTTNN